MKQNSAPAYLFCPFDGTSLRLKWEGGRELSFCTQCGFVDYQNPKPCVGILILRNNQLLLARRGIEPAKGEWDIPGGFVDGNESAENAAIREAFEETALHIQISYCLCTLPDVYGDRGALTLNIMYVASVISGEEKAQSDVDQLKWFDLDALPERLAFQHQTEALRKLKRKWSAIG